MQPKQQPSIDISPLSSVFNNVFPVSTGMQAYLKECCFDKKINKGRTILRAGQAVENIFFLKKGAVRGFIPDGTKDITTWMVVDPNLIIPILALDEGKFLSVNIQAIEPCEFIVINAECVRELYEHYPEFNIIVRKLLQQFYAEAEDRVLIARLPNAESRYRYFLDRYHHLGNRIPLKFIASFLGITIETISRVRGKLLRQVNT